MIRLYIPQSLQPQHVITLDDAQAHYVQHVMRGEVGMALALFNEKDGEWHAIISHISKKTVQAQVQTQHAPATPSPDIWLLFAPIKAGRIDYLVEKATELGVSRLIPVKTRRTIVTRVNEERLYANAVQAAEQTGRQDVPTIHPFTELEQLLSQWDTSRPLIYGDESGHGMRADKLLATERPPLALLIGPEGGFSPEEFAYFHSLPFMHPMIMGKRILRADTAAIAALTLLQHFCGDW